MQPDADVPRVVLDTNVVLDWLMFKNPVCSELYPWLASGQMRWIASLSMRDELAHVISRGSMAGRRAAEHDIWAAWDAHCTLTEDSALRDGATRLRCTDRNDQKFIDLALSQSARWLLSRDRAVLRLARHARPLRLDIMTPADWSARTVSAS